jgi:3-phenylpropionate/trans-cinnamate dioxygenase ferredoxin subunit
MAKHVVGPAADFPPGSQTVVHAGGHRIALFNVDGAFHALFDRCPHQGASLCAGYVSGRLESTGPGRFEYDPARTFVRCPWHGWEYELATGRSRTDPRSRRVRAYPVEVEDGTELRAQIVPVSQEGAYVVIDLTR